MTEEPRRKAWDEVRKKVGDKLNNFKLRSNRKHSSKTPTRDPGATEAHQSTIITASPGSPTTVPTVPSPEATVTTPNVLSPEATATTSNVRSPETPAAIEQASPDQTSIRHSADRDTNPEHQLSPSESSERQQSTRLSEEVALWREAYNAVVHSDKTLVEDYEHILQKKFGVSLAMAGISGSHREHSETVQTTPANSRTIWMVAISNKALEEASKAAEQRAEKRQPFILAAEVMTTACKAISGLLESCPPAAVALSGIAAVLPMLAKPIAALESLAKLLKHIMGQMTWYTGLVRTLLRDSWKRGSDFDQQNGQILHELRVQLLKLYTEILRLQMLGVRRYHETGWGLEPLKEIVGWTNWDDRLESLKKVEQDVKAKIDLYIGLELREELSHTSQNGAELVDLMKKTVKDLDDMTQYHFQATQQEVDKLIGRFNIVSYGDQKERNPDIVEGTCQWFCNHDKFNQWLQSTSHPTLVVSADPGCGKSTLTKHLIDVVLPQRRPQTTICYFFFKDQPKHNETPNALCALLHRLFDKQPGRAKACRSAIEKYGDGLYSNPEQLWDLLEAAFPAKSECRPEDTPTEESDVNNNVICVLDALDECQPSQLPRLLERIRSFTERTPGVKFLLTTRGYPEILRHFGSGRSDILRLAGENKKELDDIKNEITLVMKRRLDDLAGEKELDEPTRELIWNSLKKVGSSQRTYMWTELIFKILQRNYDDDKATWERLIRSIPKSISEAYGALFRRVQSDDKDFVSVLIRLVFIAERPLTLSEMNMAIAARRRVDEEQLPDIGHDENFRNRVIAACGFFVNVYDNKLFFIHQTAREFLLLPNSHDLAGLAWEDSFTEQNCHKTMAESCIAVSSKVHSLRSAEPTLDDDQVNYLMVFEFVDYAVRYMPHHFRKCQIMEGNQVIRDVASTFHRSYTSLFTGDMPFECSAFLHEDGMWESDHLTFETLLFHDGDMSNVTLSEIGPYLAVSLDHVRILQDFSTRSQCFPRLGPGKNNSLASPAPFGKIIPELITHGIYKKSKLAVQYLLETYPDVTDSYGAFLVHACSINDPEFTIVRALLGRGAPLDTCVDMQLLPRRSNYISSFWDTSRVEVLVTPLAAVFCHRHPEPFQKVLIKLLVNHGADLGKAVTESGILHFASLITDSNIGSLLDFVLEHGGKAPAVNEFGRSLLMNLCIAGPINKPPLATSIHTLLNHKVDVSQADNCGYTALHFASIRAIGSVVKMLIENGADAEPRTTIGLTPMHFACMTRTLHRSGRLLYDKKHVIGHSHTWDKIYHHPVSQILHRIWDSWWSHDFEENDVTLQAKADVMSLLAHHGASVDVEDAEGCTPLHWASLLADSDTVHLLLKDFKADATAKNHKGQTALHFVCSGVISVRSDLSPVRRISDSTSKRIVKLLLECGVDAAYVDDYGCTALDWARIRPHTRVATFLELCMKRMAEGTLADLHVPRMGEEGLYLPRFDKWEGILIE